MLWSCYNTLPIAKLFCQKYEEKVFFGIFFFSYKNCVENMKKMVGAVWELPAKKHSQSNQFPTKLGSIGWAIFLFSRQLPNCSYDIFHTFITIEIEKKRDSMTQHCFGC